MAIEIVPGRREHGRQCNHKRASLWASRLDYVPAVATDSAAPAAGNALIEEQTMARSTSVLDSITVTLI